VIRLAANVSFLFTELPFLERFAAAARVGFRAVEFAFAYDVPAAEIAQRCRTHGLVVALINAPAGDLAAGEVGLAATPGREDEVAAGFERALDYAEALSAPLIHFLAGIPPESLDERQVRATFIDNARRAALRAQEKNIAVTLEPLNRRDRPRYYLRSNAQARDLISALGRPNVRLQLDLYHCQISEGDVMKSIAEMFPLIGHVQIAGVPGRHEPDTGGIAYQDVLRQLDVLGYTGYVGCEYTPAGRTLDGLSWARPYLQQELCRT
jgi:hydroxypyruvate isomerase